MNDKTKIIDKICALLSKTTVNGCTEEEEFSALAKARALQDAYEVTDAELQLTKDEGTEGIVMRKGSHEDVHHIRSLLTTAIAKFCACKGWRDRDGKLVFLGMRSDVQLATWLLDHLTGYVLGELTDHVMGDIAIGAQRRQVINGFVSGITGRISARLNALCQPAPTASSNNRALVVVKEGLIKTKLAELGINLRSSSSRRRLDEGSFSAGRSAGDRASFGRPVTGRAATLRIGGGGK